MGALHQPPLAQLVRYVRERRGVTEFVETGTYLGHGAAFACSLFPRVVTIEVNPEFHAQAKAAFGMTQAEFVLGDSRVELPRIVAGLSGPALFWLDGHAGGGHFGDHDDCPLLEELAAIAASPHANFILVDDARAFLAPPPPPFDPDKWPDLAAIIETVRAKTPYYCIAIADTLICAPPDAKADIRAYCNAVRPQI